MPSWNYKPTDDGGEINGGGGFIISLYNVHAHIQYPLWSTLNINKDNRLKLNFGLSYFESHNKWDT